MPIQIQCTAVVARNDAINRVLDGGPDAFCELSRSGMSYSDEKLSQASFMSPVDAEEFAKLLELRGLGREGNSPDFVIVTAHDQAISPSCDWLFLFEYEQRLIATLRGSDSRTVIAASIDAEYDPNAVEHHSAEDIAKNYEFVERSEGIDTYREKATGRLVYHARQTETAEEVFARAFDTVWSHRREPGMPARQGEEAAEVRATIEGLQSLATKHPEESQVAFALGLAWFAVGDEKKAARQLRRAVELDPENAVYWKELGSCCLTANNLPDALLAATKAAAIKPNAADLLGNLAAVQLLNGLVSESSNTINHAVGLAPEDEVNRNIQQLVSAVSAGKVERPKTLDEMMRPSKSKSWLAKLLGK